MAEEELLRQTQHIRIMIAVMTRIARQDIEQRLNADGACIGSLPFGVLHLIQRRKLETIKELSQFMHLSPATLVPAVDTLEREGMVVRRKDPNDRRRTLITINEKGHDLLARMPAMRHDEHFVAAVAGLSDSQRHELLALLKEIIRRLPDGEAMVAQMEAEEKGEL